MKKSFFAIAIIIAVLALLAGQNLPARADGGGGGAWGTVFLPNGQVNWANLTNQGVVTQNVPWMPTIPGIGQIPATYSVYTTSEGNTVVMPSPLTIIFGSIASAQGQTTPFNTASSQFGTGAGFLTEVLSAVAGGGQITLTNGMTYVSPSEFAEAVIAGQESIWSLPVGNVARMLTLLYMSTTDNGVLSMLALMFTPDMCAQAPGGCPPELLAALTAIPSPTPMPPPPACPSPQVRQGAISAGGSKTAPAYPLVVGQDPAKTGVSLSFSASVAPTIYTYWQTEPVRECVSGPDAQGRYNCDNNSGHFEITGWTCVRHTQTFNECITNASARISLSQASREWILKTLSIRYPGAYVHRPEFSFGGQLACSWSATASHVQIEDPGQWLISVSGSTSGTPVTAPRNFNMGGTPFDVFLKESTIIH
jgi:hypothetical protein